MSLFSSVTNSISGLAKVATGNVSDFRKVLNLSPGLLPFTMPPQVQLGVTALKAVGINIPTPDDLLKTVNGSIDATLSSVLKGVQQPITNALGISTSALGKVFTSSEAFLNSINWLL